MGNPKRGILYLVWGEKIDGILNRSVQSVKKYYPEIPIHIVRGNARDGLMQKSLMGSLTPFESTLYLDADTIVMGNLDWAFERAEQFGIACTICECPWLRRYGPEQGDRTEYNTGVIFFSSSARQVFSTWEQIAPTTPSKSVWLTEAGERRGSSCDDQASFAQALLVSQWNPCVLPINWNFRPAAFPRVFLPIKVWHDYCDPPHQLEMLNDAITSGDAPVRLIDIIPGPQR
jgi:hypothetical protein